MSVSKKYIRSPYPTFGASSGFAVEYTAWSLKPLMWLSEAFSQNKCSVHSKINERAKMEGSAYRLAASPFFKVLNYTTWRKRGGRNSFFNTL